MKFCFMMPWQDVRPDCEAEEAMLAMYSSCMGSVSVTKYAVLLEQYSHTNIRLFCALPKQLSNMR